MLVTQDLHVHTNLSLCASRDAKLEGFVDAALKLKLDTIAITNHYWDPDVPGAPEDFYKPQNFEHICEIRKEIPAFAGRGLRILFGAEAEYCYALRKTAITEKTASQLDVLLVPNSHTHITMPPEFYYSFQKHADFMVQAYHDILNDPVSKYITAIPHAFDPVCCPYSGEYVYDCIPDSVFRECFEETAAKNIAVEINLSGFYQHPVSCFRNSNYARMCMIARDCGCKFTFGSDAHSPKGMFADLAAEPIAEFLKLGRDQIFRI